MMNEKQQARRVLNLIDKVNASGMGGKKWAIIKLLMWHAGEGRTVRRIRFTTCHCGNPLMLSYQLAGDCDRGATEETCGYYCPRCGFSNAGSRDKAMQP